MKNEIQEIKEALESHIQQLQSNGTDSRAAEEILIKVHSLQKKIEEIENV